MVDARSLWWTTRCEYDDPIPWYNESDFVDDLFAILDSNMDWEQSVDTEGEDEVSDSGREPVSIEP